MNKDPHDEAVEQRRRLLKGALSASTVMTLGYGGSAAAASLSCVAKVRDMEVGGPPANGLQFTMIKPSTTHLGTNWAWEEVQVWRYKLSKKKFDGFVVIGNLYDTAKPDTAVLGASKDSVQTGYPKKAWVLAYFDDAGNRVGTYPSYTLASKGATPAAASCLASVNPGISSKFTFGG